MDVIHLSEWELDWKCDKCQHPSVSEEHLFWYHRCYCNQLYTSLSSSSRGCHWKCDKYQRQSVSENNKHQHHHCTISEDNKHQNHHWYHHHQTVWTSITHLFEFPAFGIFVNFSWRNCMNTFQFLFIILKRFENLNNIFLMCFTSRVLSPQNKISPYSGRVQKFSAPCKHTLKIWQKHLWW